jgi:hypothetical protein
LDDDLLQPQEVKAKEMMIVNQEETDAIFYQSKNFIFEITKKIFIVVCVFFFVAYPCEFGDVKMKGEIKQSHDNKKLFPYCVHI